MVTHTLQKRRKASAKPPTKTSPAERRRLEALTRLPYHDFLGEKRSVEEYQAYAQAHGFSQGWVWHAQRSAKQNRAWRARRVARATS